MITSDEIKRRLWNGANELRGSMDASRYKDYMLGLMFYKFLSDKTLQAFARTADITNSSEQVIFDKYIEAVELYRENILNLIVNLLGYVVEPEHLYHKWTRDINNGEFELQNVIDSLQFFERKVSSRDDGDEFRGIFSSSNMDLNDNALGSSLNDRSKNVKSLILLFADLNMAELQQTDILGDAYEYLIGMFAMESGKKAGEFYTPRQVSEVIAQIVAKSGNIESIYDATVGSGSLLLTVANHLSSNQRRDLHYYGQEKNTSTYNLCRMNLILHGVKPENMEIRNGDTLAEDWPSDPNNSSKGIQFDAVVMNPPYSQKNWNKSDLKVSDPRFEVAGVLPPSSKGDYAFLLHGLYHLRETGTMGIVLPHGVLFRGGSEGIIREALIERNNLDAIIGLPANLFTNTGIPVVVIILKKNRKIGEPILVIDASKDFIKQGKQNVLQEKDIAKIVDVYLSREEVDGYSHLASREEILANEHNLNIPRYVSKHDAEIPHDVDGHLYGGVPEENIKSLTVLNKLVPDVLENSLEEIRPGYYSLNKSLDEIKQEILEHRNITDAEKRIEEKTISYFDRYWNTFKKVNNPDILRSLKDKMLLDIKEVLEDFRFIDTYDGYQVVAAAWNKYLQNDLELISNGEFYEVSRSRQANMVTKGSGSNKRQEQDGWLGTIVPNALIQNTFFVEDDQLIIDLQNQVANLESDLAELVEAAKIEDSEEADALADCLKKDENDEPLDSFVMKEINAAFKMAEKDSSEYEFLKKVKDIDDSIKTLNREIKSTKLKIDNEVEDKFLVLTEEEIDKLVYQKWFTGLTQEIVELLRKPLKEELDILTLLNERYGETLDDLDSEIDKLTSELEEMLKDLVVL